MLAALAMVASVLVAAPAVAADDPKPSLEATFTACVDVPSADFTDVAAHHPVGDIDCIAYYGITKGSNTAGTTYSPRMAVTREHMALFLTRLAIRVGIEVTSTPDHPGFTDIGDLSADSQTAIAQLADLRITHGSNIAGTTYSPADSVTRGEMALFLARLMDLMAPYGGDKSDDAHTPSDVDDLDSDDVGSPFTDINSVTVSTNNAITALYELGVVSGFNETAYAPSALVTRAVMAEFMVGVMDHSNLRPAGLSIQASEPSTFGVNDGSIVASVRDDSFAPVADQTVEIFGSDAGAFDEDGACKAATGSCVWNDGEDEELTNESGNTPADGGAARGETHVYYAWIGSEDEEEFDVDDTDHVSVSVESKKEEQAMKVTTSISKNADGFTADLDKGRSVTVTVQLVDTADSDGAADADAKDVARAGIEITVSVTRTIDPDSANDTNNDEVYSNSDVTTLTTDEDGTATYVVDAPEDDNDKDDQQIGDIDDDTVDPPTTHDEAEDLENRNDLITFTYKAVEDRAGSADPVPITIMWTENNPVTTSAKSSAPAYVLPDKDGDLAITASVTLYDQYGNGIREAGTEQQAAIGIELDAVDGDPENDGTDNVDVNRNGVAMRRVVIKKVINPANNLPGTPIFVGFTERPTVDDNDPATTVFTGVAQAKVTVIVAGTDDVNLADNQSVQVVTEADDDDVTIVVVNALRGDDDEFLANSVSTVVTGNSNLVYSYDADDTFVNGVSDDESEGELLTMKKFVEMLSGFDDDENGSLRAQVDVIVYNPDGSSIFRVTRAAGVPSQ